MLFKLSIVFATIAAIRESYNFLQSIVAIPIGVIAALDKVEKLSLNHPISTIQVIVKVFNISII